jgi:hypothetical protein
MRAFRSVGLAVAGLLFASAALADGFSTSALSPSPVAPTGVIAGAYPSGTSETTYYFAVDLKAGELASQIGFMGRPNKDKKLELDLLNASGRQVASHYIMGTLDANAEQVRVLPVDAKGRYTIRLKLTGPETTTFRVELGGSAFAAKPAPAGTSPYSVTYLAPTPVPKDGAISGSFPGGDAKYTFYYFTADLKAGDLLSQISFAGRANAPKMLQLELLDARGRAAASYYVMGELEAKRDATRKFAVDSSGRYVLRVAVKGAEGTKFKVDLGGNAFAVQ